MTCSNFMWTDETCPPNALGDVVAFCVDKSLQLIIGSEANAHHTVWDSKNINQRSESLLNFVLSEGLVIAHIGNKPTFVPKNRKEVLDSTLCSSKASDESELARFGRAIVLRSQANSLRPKHVSWV
ncbi:hypothetical protein JTB14_028190 [Gonioctena quinquepunctata]|nr:hypothetical protein JTB14_028190 [Gonioctena quinquepunctata]